MCKSLKQCHQLVENKKKHREQRWNCVVKKPSDLNILINPDKIINWINSQHFLLYGEIRAVSKLANEQQQKKMYKFAN